MFFKLTFRHHFLKVSAIFLLFLAPLISYAVPVTFTGTLIENPPCTISGDDGPINISFGNVGISKINGENYATPFNIIVDCKTINIDQDTTSLYITYSGMSVIGFEPRALQTDRDGLGILLYNDKTIIPPDATKDISINMSNNERRVFHFIAVPVKSNDASLVLLEGNFTAHASIEISYP